LVAELSDKVDVWLKKRITGAMQIALEQEHRADTSEDLVPGVEASARHHLGREVIASPWKFRDTAMLLGSILLLFAVALWCEHGRIFWEDEVLGWTLLNDPSFNHMIASWVHGADGGGISFYLTGRLWLKLFGPSMAAFRLYSQVCFAAAFALFWICLRRFYQPGLAAFAMLSVWLVSPPMVQHMGEGRFYGALMATVAWGIWLNLRVQDRPSVSASLYVAMFFCHALMVTSQMLGVVYSAVLLIWLVWLDRSQGQWRPRLYAAAAASWLLVILSLPAIRASAAVGRPFFWTTQPSPLEFGLDYTGFSPVLALPLGLLLLYLSVRIWRSGRAVKEIAEHIGARHSLYRLAFLLFLVPLLFLLEGTVGPPLCVSRYLLPVIFATTIAMAELMTQATEAMPAWMSKERVIGTAWCVFLGMLLGYDLAYRPHRTLQQKDYTLALTNSLPRGVPVVCEDSFAFTELMYRQPRSGVLYTYLLDWQNSVAAPTRRMEVTHFHLMQNWKRAGYYSDAIHSSTAFLARTPEFYTLSFEEVEKRGFFGREKMVSRAEIIGSDLHERLTADPRFRVTLFRLLPLGKLRASVWQVCRVGDRACP